MIVVLAEGDTEVALRESLKRFLDGRARAEGQPKVALRTKDIMTLNAGKLRGRIRLELRDPDVTAVLGLIDVYPHFASAAEAKGFLREAAGDEQRFHAHAAQYEVEAWLLPYWDAICGRVGVHRQSPGPYPEEVDLDHPPSHRLNELYRLARPPRRYIKPIELPAILRHQDLLIAARQCPEFRVLLNSLLTLSGLRPLE